MRPALAAADRRAGSRPPGGTRRRRGHHDRHDRPARLASRLNGAAPRRGQGRRYRLARQSDANDRRRDSRQMADDLRQERLAWTAPSLRLVLVVAAWILLKVVIGIIATVSTIVVVILAIVAVFWAVKTL